MNEKYMASLLRDEISSCLLCDKCAATVACTHGFDCGRMIRAARFENSAGATAMASIAPCIDCSEPTCMVACTKGMMDRPIRIPEIAMSLRHLCGTLGSVTMKDEPSLEIDFMGVHFENPFCL